MKLIYRKNFSIEGAHSFLCIVEKEAALFGLWVTEYSEPGDPDRVLNTVHDLVKLSKREAEGHLRRCCRFALGSR